MVKRSFGNYSSLALLPFAYLVLAHAVCIVASKYNRENEVVVVFLLIMIGSTSYLFPLMTGFLVPIAIYEPVLSLMHVTRCF